jgi:hypothetical protein
MEAQQPVASETFETLPPLQRSQPAPCLQQNKKRPIQEAASCPQTVENGS